jgi:hypothetical protein
LIILITHVLGEEYKISVAVAELSEA